MLWSSAGPDSGGKIRCPPPKSSSQEAWDCRNSDWKGTEWPLDSTSLLVGLVNSLNTSLQDPQMGAGVKVRGNQEKQHRTLLAKASGDRTFEEGKVMREDHSLHARFSQMEGALCFTLTTDILRDRGAAMSRSTSSAPRKGFP